MINQKRLIQTFIELAKIDSPSGEEALMAKEMAKRLKALGGKAEFDTFGNLIVKFRGKGEPLILNSHLDTVEPGRGIKPIVKGDIIKSDGTTIVGGDNKAGLAIILELLTSLKEDKKTHLPLEVVLTLGEEAGLTGALNLDYKMLSAKQGITLDGVGAVSNVTIAAPGYHRVDVTVIGRAAHAGAEPEKGISAIGIASLIISRLQLGRIDFETTANIGLIEGGSARNAVAEKSHFKGEIRSRNIEKLDKHISHFEEIFEAVRLEFPEAEIEVDMIREFGPYRFDKDHNMIVKMLKIFEQMGIKANLEESGGGSDVNIFNGQGIEIVDVGAGDHNLHTKDEYVVISEMVEAVEFVYKLVTTVQ